MAASTFRRLRDFYERLTEGMALQDLWNQFKSEVQASYRLYSSEIKPKEFEQAPRWKRFLRTAGQVFWVMLMKLSPARRIILLLSLLLIVAAEIQPKGNGPSPALYGALGLLLVLATELADRVTMKRDLEIARDIQRWLLPADPPNVPGFDIAFATRSANTVGGDYYDVIQRVAEHGGATRERFLLVVADVAGKSVPAALLMATFQSSLQALVTDSLSLSELVIHLNRYSCSRSRGGLSFTTAFFAELDTESRTLLYINAGHNYPICRRSFCAVERLKAGGIPLGVRTDAVYETGTASLEPGDLLVIFTDGVVEAVNDRGEEYGDARLVSLIGQKPEESAKETVRRLMADLDAFVGSARQHDDLTVLIARATAFKSERPGGPFGTAL
jgi:sigma-B regulation protein RsbU (phosphoserine phosphatase)